MKKVTWAREVNQATQDTRVRKDRMVLKAHLVQLVLKAHLVLVVLKTHLAHLLQLLLHPQLL